VRSARIRLAMVVHRADFASKQPPRTTEPVWPN
jgi:hypothetical protein